MVVYYRLQSTGLQLVLTEVGLFIEGHTVLHGIF